MNNHENDGPSFRTFLTLASVCSVLILLITFGVGFILGVLLEGSKDEMKVNNFIDNVTYLNEKEDTKMRYKYITAYDTVDEDLASKVNGEPIYSLYVDDVMVSEVHTSRKNNIPVVSDMIEVKKDEVLNLNFRIEMNDAIDKNVVRVDVRIIIEELLGGKWAPVYQTIFMERGPYWSLDKGPVEVIKTLEE